MNDEEREDKLPRNWTLSKAEHEIIINRSEVDDGWNLYTSSPTMIHRLDKWAKAIDVQRIGGKIVSKEYDLPKACVLIRKPPKKRSRPELAGRPFSAQNHAPEAESATISTPAPTSDTSNAGNRENTTDLRGCSKGGARP